MSRCLIFLSPFHILFAVFLCSFLSNVLAQPATLQAQDCFTGNITQKLNISTLYAQVLDNSLVGTYLNLTLFGQSSQEIVGTANGSNNLSTLFTSTTLLTFDVWTASSYFCTALRSPTPLPALDTSNPEIPSYCPIPAGPMAFSTSIPWGSHRELTTMTTQLRVVDPWSNELLCLNVATTPLSPEGHRFPYGAAISIFWGSVVLAIAYWLMVGIARIIAAWDRGISRPNAGLWTRMESAGFILASAISGERLATCPALMRFGTPSMRDIIFHTQWCSALAMVAVQWPDFVYPLLAQTAWSTLSYNITVTEGLGSSLQHWDPLAVAPYNPPSNFLDQINNVSSPLFIDPTVPNTLFLLPTNATSGMSSFAYAVGLRPEDLFKVSLVLFLAIISGTIVLSLSIWMIDWLASWIRGAATGGGQQTPAKLTGARSPRLSLSGRDMLDSVGPNQSIEEGKSLNGHYMFRAPSRFQLSMTTPKNWWKLRPYLNSFHGSVLHGNLVRILVLFHLPVTIFSCYEMTLPRSQTSMASAALAGISFVLFSILLPVALVIRLSMTTTNKLYDETRTLLSLGPLYNHYRHGSQLFASLLFATNLAFGITIGCGQKSGTAQAIIILCIEVASALVTSIWLPWGQGASMGLISFLFCVARIVIAVLLVILTPTISIGIGPGAWVAYGILVILALVYVAFVLMLVIKLVEAIVRVIGGIGFDRSHRVIDSGLIGVCGQLGCCGSPRKRNEPHRNRYRATDASHLERSASILPPVALVSAGTGRGSTHSGQPPSVLRPEHALRPYREESDDENGFIMGAWQSSSRPGYNILPEPQPQSPVGGGSGFSRVGGGRAHFESPYAIASGSTQTFPSIGRGSSSTAPPVFDDDESPPPSVSHVPRRQDTGLPLGAMPPPHIRTKSQSAIVEDASMFMNLGSRLTPASASEGRLQPPRVVPVADEYDEDSDSGQVKKKSWFNLRRQWPRSDCPPGNEGAATPSPMDAPSRSFVVVRDKKPSRAPHPLSNPLTEPASDPPSPTQDTPGTFVVMGRKGAS